MAQYTLGIIEESLEDASPLAALAAYLEAQRAQDMSDEPEGVWHINQYGLPELELQALLPALAGAVRPGWYIHAFDAAAGVLYVVLRGRWFRLPAVRDASWDAMIDYGLTVGVERRWTERIPLRV